MISCSFNKSEHESCRAFIELSILDFPKPEGCHIQLISFKAYKLSIKNNPAKKTLNINNKFLYLYSLKIISHI